MKRIKRLICVAVVLSVVAACLCPAAFAAKKETVLKFKADGTFRIMQLSDAHCTDQLYPELPKFLERVLDDYKPDLVVLTGDNVTSGWFMSTPMSVKSAIDQLIEPIVKRNIPFTAVYGNHDWQTVCPKKIQTMFYRSYDCCVMDSKFDYLHRTANDYILIKDHTGTKDIFNVWLIDSGTKDINDEMQPVLEQQIDWYKKTCAELKAGNDGKAIPSVVFQHIPVYEIRNLFTSVSKETEGAVHCKAFGADEYLKVKDGVDGALNSSPGLPCRNSGEYSAFVEMGDVKGVFFGHDHQNDYCGKTEDGIMLGATRCGGFQSSGDSNGKRGVRFIDIKEDNPGEISSFCVNYCDYYDGPYPAQKKEYDMGLRMSKIPEYFLMLFGIK